MLLSLLWSCSATNVPECNNSFECYTQFGVGYVCETLPGANTDSHRYCMQPTQSDDGNRTPERLQNAMEICQSTTPDGLFENWDTRSNNHLIGSLYYESSSNSGQHLTKAIDIAVEKANRNKVDGRGFTVIHCNYYENGEYSEQRIRDAVDFLVGELQVPLIFGPYRSDAALNALNQNMIHERNAVFISGSVTAGDTLGRSEYFWRTLPNDLVQGYLLNQVLVRAQSGNEPISKFIALQEDEDVYSEGLMSRINVVNADDRELFTRPSGLEDQDESARIAAIESEIRDKLTTLWSRSVENSINNEEVGLVFIASSQSDTYKAFINVFYEDETYSGVRVFMSDSAANESVLNHLNDPATSPALPESILIQGTTPYPSRNSNVQLLYNDFESDFDRYPEASNTPAASLSGYYANSRSSDWNPFTPYTYDAAWVGLYAYIWGYYRDQVSLSDTDNVYNLVSGDSVKDALKTITGAEAMNNPFTFGAADPRFNEFSSLVNASNPGFDVRGTTSELEYLNTIAGDNDELIGPMAIWNISSQNGTFLREQVNICEFASEELTEENIQCCCDAENTLTTTCSDFNQNLCP
ncbi:MAG: hypothetical protein VX278_20300 [Myxococcota bacterium]|nr:hypothetical protein [Myxococcota bacterium]